MIEKRGYVKWTDENGKRHKVKKEEYEAMDELLLGNKETPETDTDRIEDN